MGIFVLGVFLNLICFGSRIEIMDISREEGQENVILDDGVDVNEGMMLIDLRVGIVLMMKVKISSS